MVTVTGRNCSPIAVPPGPVAAPLKPIVDVPGAIASNITAPSKPVPVAPVESADANDDDVDAPVADLIVEGGVVAARAHEAAFGDRSRAQQRRIEGQAST